MSTIPAGQMKINMRINNGETISETIAETLEPNAQLVYTFPKAVDFSDVIPNIFYLYGLHYPGPKCRQ